MVPTEIVIIVLLALSAIYTSESRELPQPPLVHHHDYQSDDQTNEPECLCFENSRSEAMKVPEILQSSQGLERLVIYLYRDVDTSQIRMYEPNSEKQKLIPDLPFENGDWLTPISMETIQTIFNRSPYKTSLLSEKSGNEYRDAVPVPVKNIDSNLWKAKDAQIEINDEQDFTSIHVSEAQENVSEYNYIDYSNEKVINGIDDQYLGGDIKLQPAVTPHAVLLKQPQQKQGQFSEWITDQMKTFNNYESHGQEKINLDVIKNSIIHILHENGMHLSKNGVLLDVYGKVLDIHSLSLRPILVGSTMSFGNLLHQREPHSSHLKWPYLQAVLLIATNPPRILGVLPLGKTYLPLRNLANIWKTDAQVNINKLLSPDLLKIINSFDKGTFEADKVKQNMQEYIDGVEDMSDVTDTKNVPEQEADDFTVENEVASTVESLNMPELIRKYNLAIKPAILESKVNNIPTSGLVSKFGDRFYSASTIYDNYKENFPKDNANTEQQTHNTDVTSTAESDHPEMSKKYNLDIRSPISASKINKISRSDLLGIYNDPYKTSQELKLADKFSRFLPGSVIIASQENTSLPDLSRMMNLPTINLGQNVYRRQYEPRYMGPSTILASEFQGNNYLPRLVNPVPLFSSRSGTVPDVPALPDSSPNEVYDYLVGGEDDDDDDGDFRIIGGNAATGSGTPLSNKGRSGYNY